MSSHFRRRGRGGFGYSSSNNNNNNNMVHGSAGNFERVGNRFMQQADGNE